MYAIVGSDSTWRCWQLDGSFTILDISITVLPAELRSAAVGGGTFVGPANGRIIGAVDTDSIPGAVSIYFYYGVNPTPGNTWKVFKWVSNAATWTTTGALGGDVGHAMTSIKAAGGERIFTPGELDILIVNSAPVIGGERIYFMAWGDAGPTNKTVEFYYNRQGEPVTALATLSGTATGGVATRVGNQVLNINADGATTYQITWNFTANSIASGDRVQLVPRIST